MAQRSFLSSAASMVRLGAARLGKTLLDISAMPPVATEPPRPATPPLETDKQALTTRVFTGNVPMTEVYNRIDHGRNIDLDRIASAIDWANRGMMAALADIEREAVFNDPTLAGLLLKRFGNLSVVDWDVTPAAGVGINPLRAKQIADDVRQMLAGLRGFRQDVYDLAWAAFDGRAALEIQWAYLGGRRPWRPYQIDWIHPARLSYGPERELRVVERGRMNGYFRELGPALRDYPGKFIWWTPRMFADYAEREGLGPRCLYWAFFKRFSWRHRMMLTELFGLPWRIVETEKDATLAPDALDDARTKADMLGGSTSAAFPPGMKLRVEAPHPESGEFFGMTGKEVNEELAKLISGTTTAMEGDANRANAVVGASQQDIIFQRDGNGQEERWQEQLIRVYVELNYGYEALVYVPTFRFRTQPPRDRKAELERVEKVITFGLDVAEGEIREISGLRQPAPNEPVVRRLPSSPAGAPAAPSDGQTVPGSEGGATDVIAQVISDMEKDLTDGPDTGEKDAGLLAENEQHTPARLAEVLHAAGLKTSPRLLRALRRLPEDQAVEFVWKALLLRDERAKAGASTPAGT